MSYYLYGKHTVTQLLNSQPETVACLFSLAKPSIDNLKNASAWFALAQTHRIPIQTSSRHALDQMVNSTQHQGVVAKVSRHALRPFQALEQLLQGPKGLLIALDGINDPQNLGACIRSAWAAGAKGLFFSQANTAPMTAAAHKAACGASFQLPLCSPTNLSRALKTCQQAGYWVIGTTLEATKSLYQTTLNHPTVLVFGSEKSGLRALTRETCDEVCHIPMAQMGASLNVSAATAVSCFEWRRQQLLT